MSRVASSFLSILAISLLLGGSGFMTSAKAQSECERATPGKCKVGQTAIPKKTKGGTVTHQATQPPSKANHKGRDEYTPAQREEFMERARKLCREKYGAPSRVYRVDFKRMEVWCLPPSF